VDLTEPREMPPYDVFLPSETPEGRRVAYLRAPLPDHGVPASREDMARIVGLIDDALEAGHVVYLHCRAGIGRSATVAGCWLASRPGRDLQALDELQLRWQQSDRSEAWPQVPETEEQAAFVSSWDVMSAARSPVQPAGRPDLCSRARGALLGLAAGDAAGCAVESGRGTAASWTQHTALALCLAESLLECGRSDARDQIERYTRWQREGHLAASGQPSAVTPDVAKALATYQWRHLPMAGSHDPRDRSTAALPRVVGAVLYSLSDPESAVQLAGECARTTHQSPYVIDACRYYAAMLVGAFRGAAPGTVLEGLYEPVAGLWAARPLKPAVAEVLRAGKSPKPVRAAKEARAPDAARALARARAAVAGAADFEDALRRACSAAVEPGLEAALAGTLMGALFGAEAIPRERLADLDRTELLEGFASRLCGARRGGGPEAAREGSRP
jgi:ADP-ribosylglycohydrolase